MGKGSPVDSTPRSSASSLTVRMNVIEIVGHVGAAIGLSATGIALGETSGTGVLIVTDLIVVGVLLFAGAAIGGRARDRFLRMRSIFWFLSVLAFTDLAALVVTDGLDVQGKSVALLTAIPVTAFGFALWILSRRSLQVIAVLIAADIALVIAVFQEPGGFIPIPNLTPPAIASWLFGVAVLIAGARDVLTPRLSAMVVGGVIAILSPLFIDFDFVGGGSVSLVGEILALLTAFALLAVGETMGERPPAGLGIAGTLFVTAAIVGDNIHEQGSGIGALVAGLFLLAGALFAIRGTEAEMSTSPPIPPIPPMPSDPPAGSSPPGLD
jgi:hypothetical protein